MQTTLLKAKLHCTCVARMDPHFEGEFAIDGDLLELAGIHNHEQIHVYNTRNGEHLISYAIRAEHGSRTIAVNGAAAHKVAVGDRLIICAYANLSNQELIGFKPALVYCDEHNYVTGAVNVMPLQMAS